MSDPRPVPQPPVRKVPCPNCGQPAVFGASNRWRPFCGERCRGMDLGAWASESYRMPAANPPDDPDPQG